MYSVIVDRLGEGSSERNCCWSLIKSFVRHCFFQVCATAFQNQLLVYGMSYDHKCEQNIKMASSE